MATATTHSSDANLIGNLRYVQKHNNHTRRHRHVWCLLHQPGAPATRFVITGQAHKWELRSPFQRYSVCKQQICGRRAVASLLLGDANMITSLPSAAAAPPLQHPRACFCSTKQLCETQHAHAANLLTQQPLVLPVAQAAKSAAEQ